MSACVAHARAPPASRSLEIAQIAQNGIDPTLTYSTHAHNQANGRVALAPHRSTRRVRRDNPRPRARRPGGKDENFHE